MNITPIAPVGKTGKETVSFGMNYTKGTKKFITRFIATDTNSDFFENKQIISRRINNVLCLKSPEHSDNPMSIQQTNFRNVYEFSLDGFSQNYVLIKQSGMCYEKMQANIQKFIECFDKFASGRKNISRTASMGTDEFRV